MPFKAVVLSRQAAQGEKKAATGNVLLVHVNVRAGVVQAKELAPKTRCNVIAPGMIKTGQSEFATTPTQLNSTVYQDTPQCAMKQKNLRFGLRQHFQSRCGIRPQRAGQKWRLKCRRKASCGGSARRTR
jgi:hypothetical protein